MAHYSQELAFVAPLFREIDKLFNIDQGIDGTYLCYVTMVICVYHVRFINAPEAKPQSRKQ